MITVSNWSYGTGCMERFAYPRTNQNHSALGWVTRRMESGAVSAGSTFGRFGFLLSESGPRKVPVENQGSLNSYCRSCLLWLLFGGEYRSDYGVASTDSKNCIIVQCNSLMWLRFAGAYSATPEVKNAKPSSWCMPFLMATKATCGARA